MDQQIMGSLLKRVVSCPMIRTVGGVREFRTVIGLERFRCRFHVFVSVGDH